MISNLVDDNFSPEEVMDLPIEKAMPQIFKRGIAYVAPSSSIASTALFLIPIRELFMSGIVVMLENKPVGRIGPKHILEKVIEKGYENCLKLSAQDIMIKIDNQIESKFALAELLEVFQKTKFGFYPITKNNLLVGTVSTRDFLPIISKMKIDLPVSSASSEMIYISDGISIENALRIMIKKQIRKIAVKADDSFKIVDDRALLEYLFLSERGKPNILDTDIGVLPKSNVAGIKPDTSISAAASILLKEDLPCSIYEDRIFTPWDLVIKVLGTYAKRQNMNETVLLD
jgi:predicted transcriptional regulator